MGSTPQHVAFGTGHFSELFSNSSDGNKTNPEAAGGSAARGGGRQGGSYRASPSTAGVSGAGPRGGEGRAGPGLGPRCWGTRPPPNASHLWGQPGAEVLGRLALDLIAAKQLKCFNQCKTGPEGAGRGMGGACSGRGRAALCAGAGGDPGPAARAIEVTDEWDVPDAPHSSSPLPQGRRELHE